MDTKQLIQKKKMYKENPFASPTEVAAGDFFVGRKSVLKKCMTMLYMKIEFAITILLAFQESENLLY